MTAAKSERLLQIYSKLANGEILKKKELAQHFHVTERSIQRDIEALRCFFAEEGLLQNVVYDKSTRGYRMENPALQTLENSEILAVCKILLESRSMRRDEMFPILDKLVACCVPERNRKAVQALLANEKHHYIEPHHRQSVLNGMWELGQAIQSQQMVEIEYERLKEPRMVKRRVKPVGIMFSEYYFYLTAFLEDKESFENPDDLFPTIYRIDRIRSCRVLDEHLRCLIKTDSRKVSSASGCSSCTAGSWSAFSSNTQDRPSRPYWTGCPRRRSWSRPRTAGSSKRRCLERALICGLGVRAKI